MLPRASVHNFISVPKVDRRDLISIRIGGDRDIPFLNAAYRQYITDSGIRFYRITRIMHSDIKTCARNVIGEEAAFRATCLSTVKDPRSA